MSKNIIKIFVVVMAFFITQLSCKQQDNSQLVLTEENHNQYYSKGTDLINPYMDLEGTNITISAKAKDSIIEGIRYLDAVTKINPANFAAYWIKGKGYQSLLQHDSAYSQFDKSFELNKDNPDVARELMIECLYLGKGKEAIATSLHALSLDTSNAGLIGNLALAYLINGDLNLAEETISKAVKINPEDEINLTLNKVINEVINGKRNRPTKYSDIKL